MSRVRARQGGSRQRAGSCALVVSEELDDTLFVGELTLNAVAVTIAHLDFVLRDGGRRFTVVIGLDERKGLRDGLPLMGRTMKRKHSDRGDSSCRGPF